MCSVRIHHTHQFAVNLKNLSCDVQHFILTDWYNQKLAHPWYLPSVNQYLSLMTNESWVLTPNHTNIVETAHAARNADTGIRRPLLAAINEYVLCLSL